MKKVKIGSVELIGFNFYKIILINIYKSYSDYLANFIKYILFSLIKGFGITELKIFGINNEFDNIFGVKEDVINLIFNLKGVIFKLVKKKKLIVNLYKFGKCIVKASDLCSKNWLKIINPNHIIAHLSEDSILAMSIKIEKNRGYNFINDDNYKKKKDINNSILLDVNFSPILKVYYKIENLNLKYNKIIFFIQTNGSISSLTAFKKSINILLNQFSKFTINKKKKQNIYFNLNKNYFINIFKLKLSNHMFYYFRLLKINYLGDLIQYSKNDLIKLISSKIFYKNLEKFLLKYKLSLNVYIENWIYILNNFLKKKSHETFKKKI